MASSAHRVSSDHGAEAEGSVQPTSPLTAPLENRVPDKDLAEPTIPTSNGKAVEIDSTARDRMASLPVAEPNRSTPPTNRHPSIPASELEVIEDHASKDLERGEPNIEAVHNLRPASVEYRKTDNAHFQSSPAKCPGLPLFSRSSTREEDLEKGPNQGMSPTNERSIAQENRISRALGESPCRSTGSRSRLSWGSSTSGPSDQQRHPRLLSQRTKWELGPERNNEPMDEPGTPRQSLAPPPRLLGTHFDRHKQSCCEHFEISIMGFYINKREQRALTKQPVYKVLYDVGPNAIQAEVEKDPRCPGKPSFTWYHIPANNMTWVEHLITRLREEKRADHPVPSQKLNMMDASVRENLRFRQPDQSDKAITIDSFLQHQFHKSEIPVSDKEDASTQQVLTVVLPYLSCEKYGSLLEMKETIERCKENAKENAKDLPYPDDGLYRDRTSGHAESGVDLESEVSGVQSYHQHTAEEASDDQLPFDSTPRQALRERDYSYPKQVREFSRKLHKDLILGYGYRQSPLEAGLQVRRTLDQYRYSHVGNIDERDADQVVYRYMKSQIMAHDNDKLHKLFMVDQLWMWVLGHDTVITCLPAPWDYIHFGGFADYRGSMDPHKRLSKYLMDDQLRQPIVSAHCLAMAVMTECVGLFRRPNQLNSYTPEEISAWVDFFDFFDKSITNSSAKVAESLVKMKDYVLKAELASISEDLILLVEVSDIIDELEMLREVLEDQKNVLLGYNNAMNKFKLRRVPNKGEYRVPIMSLSSSDDHLEQIKHMKKLAETTREKLNNVLDRKQQHNSHLQARATAKQGNAIMLFTMITIIFLPVSFMAAFFAIPTDGFKQTEGKIPFNYVLKYILSIGLSLSLPFIVIALNLDTVVRSLNNIRNRLPRPPRLYDLYGYVIISLDWITYALPDSSFAYLCRAFFSRS